MRRPRLPSRAAPIRSGMLRNNISRDEREDDRMRELQQVREGQIVRVINGPFSGFRGEVTAVDEQTVNVAVQVFGRVTPVDLAFRQIELVPEISN